MYKKQARFVALVLCLLLILSGCGNNLPQNQDENIAYDLANVPSFTNEPYVVINNNVPFFNDEDKSTQSFENYANLDNLGRCGVAFANIGMDIMPTQKRGSIGQVKPSGWQTVKYDCVDGKYLYNRCHLIGYQLSGENANEKNLITGTRYMNVDGMLPFENMVCDYVKETNNHVLYRVTPIFTDDNLVADAVLMEGLSVEDEGEGICFNVYVYNNQPQISIDYKTGESTFVGDEVAQDVETNVGLVENESVKESESVNVVEDNVSAKEYVLNTSSKKFHLKDCTSVKDIKESNKEEVCVSRDDLLEQGYSPCKRCNP